MTTKPDPTKDETGAAKPRTLREILRDHKVTRPTETVTIPLDQAAARDIRRLEAELHALAAADPNAAAGAKGKALARKAQAASKKMAESEVEFTFRGLSSAEASEVIEAMGDRTDADEYNLRIYAAMCTEPADVTWEDMRALRDGDSDSDVEGIGGALFTATVVAACDQIADGELTVPFSSIASRILSMPR